MHSKLTLIGRILGIAIGVIGVFIFAAVAWSEKYASGFVNFGIIATVFAVWTASLSAVLTLVVNPQRVKKILLSLLAVLVIALFSWFTADGSDYVLYKDVTEFESRASSAMLTSFYLLFSGAILAVVYSLVSRVTK